MSTIRSMFRKEELSRLRALARQLGVKVGNRDLETSQPPPASRSVGKHKWTWNRSPRTVPGTATIRMRASSSVERDAALAVAFGDWDLDSDPDALDLAREAYQEGLDEAISEQVDMFVRNYLAT